MKILVIFLFFGFATSSFMSKIRNAYQKLNSHFNVLASSDPVDILVKYNGEEFVRKNMNGYEEHVTKKRQTFGNADKKFKSAATESKSNDEIIDEETAVLHFPHVSLGYALVQLFCCFGFFLLGALGSFIYFASRQKDGILNPDSDKLAQSLGLLFAIMLTKAWKNELPNDSLEDIYQLVQGALERAAENAMGNESHKAFSRTFLSSFKQSFFTAEFVSKSTSSRDNSKDHKTAPSSRASHAEQTDESCSNAAERSPKRWIHGRHIAVTGAESEATSRPPVQQTHAAMVSSRPEEKNGILPPRASTDLYMPLVFAFFNIMERNNAALDFQNALSLKKLENTEKKLMSQSEQNRISVQANQIMEKQNELSSEKIVLKSGEVRDMKQSLRASQFLNAMADSLQTAMVLLVLSMAASVYYFSKTLLKSSLQICKSKGGFLSTVASWLLPSSLQRWISLSVCSFTASSFVSMALIFLLCVFWSIAQMDASKYQKSPMFSIILSLGCLCAAIGYFIVSSAGGSGAVFLVFWEAICVSHVLSAWWPATLSTVLCGEDSKEIFGGHGSRRMLWIHSFLLSFALPVAAGVLPFVRFVM